MTASPPRPPAVLLMGPTATGKTELAVALVERLPMDIISVDSALVYRGMDIGTAKPEPEILARAPHRLVDILDPTEAYSAARFRADALAAMDEIQARGRVPLLVGGTMLYFHTLQQGLSRLPAADPAVRAELEQEAAARGWAYLHAQLAQVDPEAAQRIHPNDPQRIQRALEVYRLTGLPLTEHFRRQAQAAAPFQLHKLALVPPARETVREQIRLRFEAMLEQGLVAEVEGLRERYDLHLELPSMRCVGYRQVLKYLQGDYTYEDMRERGVTATRQLAKRQMTWLRARPDAVTMPAYAPGLLDKVLKYLAELRIPGI